MHGAENTNISVGVKLICTQFAQIKLIWVPYWKNDANLPQAHDILLWPHVVHMWTISPTWNADEPQISCLLDYRKEMILSRNDFVGKPKDMRKREGHLKVDQNASCLHSALWTCISLCSGKPARSACWTDLTDILQLKLQWIDLLAPFLMFVRGCTYHHNHFLIPFSNSEGVSR